MPHCAVDTVTLNPIFYGHVRVPALQRHRIRTCVKVFHFGLDARTHTRAAHASVDWQVESLGACDGQNSYLCFKERHDHDWEWLLWDQYKGLLWLCTFYMSFFVLPNHLSDRNMSLPWDFTQRHHVIYKQKIYILRVHHGLIIQGYVSQLTEFIPQVCVAILHKQTKSE